MSTIKHNDRIIQICLLSLAVLSIFTLCNKNYEHNSQLMTGPNQPLRISSAGSDAAEPAIATASDGTVYLAWVKHGPQNQADVMLALYKSAGQLQESAVVVNSESGIATAWRGDPPTVTVAPDNTVLVGWTARDKSESGHASVIYVSASRDHGKTFDKPVKVNDDSRPAVHGMHSLAVAQDGRIYVAWLDERNITPMPMNMKLDPSKGGHHMEGNRELFIAQSTDGGRTFSANQRIATDVCPCCKTALAIGPDGHVYVSWRQVLPGDFRHIAVAGSTDGGKTFSTPVIVSDDQWVLKGCPVSGAGLSVDADGKLKVLWYAGAENTQPGIYWSESQDGGKSFSPRKLLASGFARSTPVLVSGGPNNPFAIWESSGTNGSEVRATSFGALTEPKQFLITQNAELPAAVVQNRHMLVTYVAKEGEKRNVWLRSGSL